MNRVHRSSCAMLSMLMAFAVVGGGLAE